MKLLYFDDFKLGVLKGDSVVDVSAVVADIPHIGPHDLISGLIARFADYRARLEEAAARTLVARLPMTTAISASPSKIVAGTSGSTIVSPGPMMLLGDLWKALIGAGSLRVPSSM